MKELFLSCALSLTPVSANGFTESDAAFFSMLRAMSPNGYIGIAAHNELPRIVTNVPPGGFILIDGPYGRVLEYFRGRDFERLPMLWRDKHIYRRQIGRSA